MMLYTEQNVKDNIRNREGKRVFFLGKEDRLTPGARDWLAKERIPVLSSGEARREEQAVLGGGFVREKPVSIPIFSRRSLYSSKYSGSRIRAIVRTSAILFAVRQHTMFISSLEVTAIKISASSLEKAFSILACPSLFLVVSISIRSTFAIGNSFFTISSICWVPALKAPIYLEPQVGQFFTDIISYPQ